MKMNHWIEKDGKVIAIFSEEKMADVFLETIDDGESKEKGRKFDFFRWLKELF